MASEGMNCIPPVRPVLKQSSISATVIDCRSDTVTKPCSGIRKAMSEAVVGDDVMSDDPTVKQLEAKVAQMLGKDDGLFVPSGE